MAKRIVPVFMLAALAALCLARGGAGPAEGGAEIPAEEKYVALTFDDGPRRATTERLLDGLRERGVRATFFLIGRQIEDNAALVARMAEEGHQIGNHTWSHQPLDNILPDEAAREVARTEAALETLLGGGEYWLRPPYGQVPEGADFGVPMVKWCVDPRDWETRATKRWPGPSWTTWSRGASFCSTISIPRRWTRRCGWWTGCRRRATGSSRWRSCCG